MAEAKEIRLGESGGRGNKLPPAGTSPSMRELPSAMTGHVWRQIPGTSKWALVPVSLVRGPYVTKS